MRARLRTVFGSLHASPVFRRYFRAQSISIAGWWMQGFALSWLILDMTDSATSVGMLMAFQYLPVLVLAPFAGVLIDRHETRRVLIVTCLANTSLAVVLFALTITGVAEVWMLYLVAACCGVVSSVDSPARQTIVLELVGPAHLTNAIALSSVSQNGARIVGPSLGAVLVATLGLGNCFLITALGYLVLATTLARVSPSELTEQVAAGRSAGQLREGFRHVWSTPSLRTTILVLAAVGALTYEWQVSLSAMARYTFDGDATTYAQMVTAMGIGAIIGGLGVASRRHEGVTSVIRISVWFGVAVLAASFAPGLPIALVALVVVGAFSVVFLVRCNTTLQLEGDPAQRGRVMSLYAMAIMGSTPIGAPIVGWVGEHVGPRWALGVGGVTCLAAAAYGLAARRDTRSPSTEAELATTG